MSSFPGFQKEAYAFLLNLSLENNKAFFTAHRTDYEQLVLNPLRALAADLEPLMLSINGAFDTRPVVGGALSRIHRDTRFSRDKSPYRDHMWLEYKNKAEDAAKLCFYFSFSPRGLSCGLGLYAATAAEMKQFRGHAMLGAARFSALHENLLARGFAFHGPPYKRPPATHTNPAVNALLAVKTFHYGRDIPMDMAAVPAFSQYLTDQFTALTELYRFFNQ